MLTLHHLETSRSQRILWLLEELGVSYELKLYRRNPLTRLNHGLQAAVLKGLGLSWRNANRAAPRFALGGGAKTPEAVAGSHGIGGDSSGSANYNLINIWPASEWIDHGK